MKTPKISESEVANDFLTMFNKGLDIWASIDLRENKNEPPPAREIYDLCLCFAARMMFHEIEERGYTYEQCLATEDGARQCVIRFYEWMLARARGFRLLLLKENPEGEHPDKEINDAIFAAHLAKRGELQHPFLDRNGCSPAREDSVYSCLKRIQRESTRTKKLMTPFSRHIWQSVGNYSILSLISSIWKNFQKPQRITLTEY